MSNRSQRLQDLQTAVKQYVQNEQTRINNEVQVLTDVLNGRTGGAGVQQTSTAVVAAVAQNDLTDYLSS